MLFDIYTALTMMMVDILEVGRLAPSRGITSGLARPLRADEGVASQRGQKGG